MAFNIGVNVVEVDGKASPGIVAAPISVGGFLIRSQRGPANLAIQLRGAVDFRNNFGDFISNAFGAHAVRGFFDNEGSTAYAVRVTGTGAQAARVDLNDRLGAATLRVQAGVHGRPDPGVWGNDLRVSASDHPRGTTDVPAQIIGGTAEPFALAAGQTLAVMVNGGLVPEIVTFNAVDFANIAQASASEVAFVIQRQTTAFRAAVTANQHLIIASGIPGPASHLAVTAGTAATTLGFAGATLNSNGGLTVGSTEIMLQSTGGLLSGSAVRLETRGHVVAPNAMAASVAVNAGIQVTPDGGAPVTVSFVDSDFIGGVAAITPGEAVVAINRQAAGFIAALNQQNRLVILSNTFGPASSIAIAAAAPDATAALGLTGNVPVAGTRVNRALTSVSEGYRTAGFTAALAAAVPPFAARVQSAEFDLIIHYSGVEVERFESLSMENGLEYYAVSVINDENAGSRYVMVTDLNSASGAAQDVPAVVTQQAMTTPGIDGNAPTDIQYVGDQAARSGLYAFDPVGIQLLCCPETTSPGVVTAALSYCERRGDAMFIGTAPFGLDLADTINYATAFRGRKVYGALYAPWIQVLNPRDTTGANPLLSIPPVGHVMGTFARIGEARGVWKAPAGDEARLNNALAVEFDMTDTEHTNLVKDGSVNGIRAIPGAGIIIDASRTLSTDTRWLYVNVRRLFNFVKSSLREGLRFVAQEPASEDLRRAVRLNVIRPFLLGLWRQGAFGSDPAEQVFSIICDATNNPPADVQQGIFRVEVYFYPVKPAETIIIVVGQQESGATAAEA